MNQKRNFNNDWMLEEWAKGWLLPIEDAPNWLEKQFAQGAYCKVCKVGLQCHKKDLKRHGQTEKHKCGMDALKPANSITKYGLVNISKDRKIFEIKMAMFIATHASIASVNHLCDLFQSTFKLNNNNSVPLRMHRTKCSALIKFVISPTLLEELIINVGDGQYSILVDESTDISRVKWMAICIRYFNEKEIKVMTEFLCILMVEEATAEALFKLIGDYFTKAGLKLKNMVAIGTDGASNMCGKHKSLYTLLKKENTSLKLVKCICHSINLCSSQASKAIPSSVEFLIRELYNYFAHSPLRTLKYKEVFDLINLGTDSNNFYRLVQISNTRWLSFGKAVKRVLEQWIELDYHFTIIASTKKDKMSQHLADELKNPFNKLYLLFLNPILEEVNKVNLLFQSDYIDPYSAYEHLILLFVTTCSKFMKSEFVTTDIEEMKVKLNDADCYLDISEIDLGTLCKEELTQHKFDDVDVITFKINCFQYLLTLSQEMSKRFPDNLKTLGEFKSLQYKSIIKREKFDTVYEILKNSLNKDVSLSVYENQWNKLPFIDWSKLTKKDITKDIFAFWATVNEYEDNVGNFFFKELSLAVFQLMVLPISNAFVERIFSCINVTKTKLRNKLQYEMLESLIRVKSHLNIYNICCYNYDVSDKMLKRFNSEHMYNQHDVEDLDELAVYEAFNL